MLPATIVLGIAEWVLHRYVMQADLRAQAKKKNKNTRLNMKNPSEVTRALL